MNKAFDLPSPLVVAGRVWRQIFLIFVFRTTGVRGARYARHPGGASPASRKRTDRKKKGERGEERAAVIE